MHDFSGYIFNILLEKDKVVVIEYMENCTVTSCYRCNVLVILPAQPIPYKYPPKNSLFTNEVFMMQTCIPTFFNTSPEIFK